MNFSVFSPGTTSTLSAAAASSSALLAGTGSCVEVQNAGTVAVFIRFGISSVTAAATDYPVLPGQSKVVVRDPANQMYIAVIAPGGTATVYATTGEGA